MPTIPALLWFLISCWVALGLGGYFLRTLKIETVNPLRGLYLRLAAGLAVLSFLTTIAGYIHLWCPLGAKIGFLVLAVAAIPVNRQFLRGMRSRMPQRERYGLEATILIMGIAAMWILLGMNSLAPIINFDAERYHYLMPKLYLEHGSFFDYPPNPFPAYPMSIEMLFLNGFALAGQQVASLIDWLICLLAIMATIEFCSRHLDLTTGLWAAAIFSSLAYINGLVGDGYVDLAVASFMLLGLYVLMDWFSSHRISEAALTGLFLGTAVAGKYYALLWVAFLAVGFVWHWIRVSKPARKNIGRSAIVAAAVILVPGVPWYGRNVIQYGNPVHPFLHTFIAGERLLDDDIIRWAGPTVHPKTFVNFIRYLGDLTFLQTQTNRFSLAYFHPFLCLFPFFGLFGLGKPFSRWCYIYSWAFTIYAFFLIPFQTRYFLPYEMLMAISIAAGMKRLSVRRPIMVVFTVLILIPLGFELNEAREEFTMRREVILGQVTEMKYLVDRQYDYQVFQYANEKLPGGSKVLYLRERTFYLDAPHEVVESRLNFDDARNPEKMLDKLRDLGYTHVMVELDVMSTLNVLDAILDELPYEGHGGIVGEGELKYVEFDYWPLAYSVHADREMTANVLPAIIEVFGGVAIDDTPKAERYRMDLSPLRKKQYLTAYASLASELRPWHEGGIVATGWFAGNTQMFDITEQPPSEKESDAYEEEN